MTRWLRKVTVVSSLLLPSCCAENWYCSFFSACVLIVYRPFPFPALNQSLCGITNTVKNYNSQEGLLRQKKVES